MAKRGCCTWPRVAALFIVVVVAAILIWLFVPWEDTVNSVLGGAEDNSTKAPTPSPAPTVPPFQFDQCTGPEQDCCNGIDGLCDFRVDQVMFGTSHNSFASRDRDFIAFPNQLLDIEQSMTAGIRGINIDMCNCGGSHVLCHGSDTFGGCAEAAGRRDPDVVFPAIKTFLDSNPTEIIVILMEVNNQADPDNLVDLNVVGSQLTSAGLTDMLYVYDPAVNPTWPTLGEMKEANKRALLFYWNGSDCNNDNSCPTGLHYYFTYTAETEYRFSSKDAIDDTATSCLITRGDAGTKDFFGVNVFTSIPRQSTAKEINEKDYLNTRIDTCSLLNNGLPVSFVYIDFWHFGDLLEVVQTRNTALVGGQTRKERKALRI